MELLNATRLAAAYTQGLAPDGRESLVVVAKGTFDLPLDGSEARLAEQVAALLETSDRFDQDRLTQEALLIATKADIREELDRIASHIAQAREMLGKGGPVGRRLDFLAQEFNREANTLCSKAFDKRLTTIGMELKAVIDQFREQVQNLA